MFSFEGINFKDNVKYMEMVVLANAVVNQIVSGNLSYIGKDYYYNLGLMTTFTDCDTKTIDEDIDGFMAEVYGGNVMRKLTNNCDTKMLDAFEKMVNEGVAMRMNETGADKLISKLTEAVENVNNLVTKINNGEIDLGKLIGGNAEE